MIRYECDRCGARLLANDAGRFIVRIEVYAAATHVDLDSETARYAGQGVTEVLAELAKADPNEVEDKTYRCLRFDVCDACRKTLLARPLG